MEGKVAGDVFGAIAAPVRRDLLAYLSDGEKPVTEITASFRMTMAGISQHLRVLRDANLVTVRQAGRQRFYKLNPEPLQQVADWVAHYEAFWRDKMSALGDYLEKIDEAKS